MDSSGSVGICSVIHTITSGFVGGKARKSVRRGHLHDEFMVHLVASRQCMPVISFFGDDFRGINLNQNDPIVIEVDVANCTVKRVLVDQGSLSYILYWNTFKDLKLPIHGLKLYSGTLIGFHRDQVEVQGSIDLVTTFEEFPKSKSVMVKYLVIDARSPYNISLRRTCLNHLGAIVTTPHFTMKFPWDSGEVILVVVPDDVGVAAELDSTLLGGLRGRGA